MRIVTNGNRGLITAAFVALEATLGIMPDAPRLYAQPRDTIVKQAGAPLHPGAPSLVPELKIGVADGPEEYMFSGGLEMAVARDGSIYVYDSRGKALRKYDAAGKFVATFGREGQGPGEHQQANGLAVLPDGRVILRDPRNQRINVYSPTGEPAAHWPLPSATNSFGSRMLMVDTGGVVYVAATLGAPSPDRPRERGTIRLSSSGRIIDTVRAPVFADEPVELSASSPGGARAGRPTPSISASTPVPFTPTGMWAWSPLGYMVTGFSSRYAVDLRVPPAARGSPPRTWQPGDPVISIRRAVAPVQVAAAERDQRRAQVETSMRNTDPQWRWNGPEIPRTKPPYRELWVGADGRIWVSVSLPSAPRTVDGPPDAQGPQTRRTTWTQPLAFDVFEPDGRYVGQVPIPSGTYPHVMRGDHIWGTTTDADGVPSVHRFRIAWP
jgi:hypothetical protein